MVALPQETLRRLITPTNSATPSARFNSPINVKWFGATGDGVTDDTAAVLAAIARAIAVSGTVYFPAGVYIVSGLSIKASNVGVLGDGSSVTIIRQKAGTSSPSVLEFGDLVAGNAATPRTGLRAYGLTLDGNKANTVQPATDLTSWGLSLTAVSNSFFDDIRAINCWNGGVGVFINSNYNYGVCYVENCGEGHTTGPTHEPGFDINSSKWNHFRVTSKGCRSGARLLDNCWGNILDLVIEDAGINGFIYSNQQVNNSYDNQIRVNIRGGCTAQAVLVSTNCRNSTIIANIADVTGIAVHEEAGISDPYTPEANTYIINTRNCSRESCRIGGIGGNWNVVSDKDGTSGAQGDFFVADFRSGAIYNLIQLNLTDVTPWKVRGIAFRSGANFNQVTAFNFNNRTTGDPYSDAGTGNQLCTGDGVGADIASANEIRIPFHGEIFRITGTDTIASIQAPRRGRFTLYFADSVLVQEGGNLKMTGDFNATVDDTLTMFSDGTNCYEICRSAN